MNMEITVTEALELINEIRKQPGDLFEMIRADVKQSVSQYMSELMEVELTNFLGRKRYQRVAGNSNHRNGSYPRKYTLKGIGKVAVRVPRDRKGDFETKVIPRSKQYEDVLREDICAMFLSGVSTRTLSLISEKLIGRKISPTEVSKASKQLAKAVAQCSRPCCGVTSLPASSTTSATGRSSHFGCGCATTQAWATPSSATM